MTRCRILREGEGMPPEQWNPLKDLQGNLASVAAKQQVRNIIRSYHHPTDVLAEPIQNAVDEVEQALRVGAIDAGKVTVVLDTQQNQISVIDNGRGISSEQV